MEGKGEDSVFAEGHSLAICKNIAIKDPWIPFVNGKLSVLGASSGPSSSMWAELCKVLSGFPSSTRACLLKTLINSLATSRRMGEVPLLPYVSGFEAKENNPIHYLEWSPLWTLAAYACGLPISFLSLPPLDRLCIVKKSATGLTL